MKLSSVEWLEKQLRDLSFNKNTHLGLGDIRVTQGFIDEIVDQAKEIHKKEIIEAREDGIKKGYGDYIDTQWGRDTETKSSEQYYSEKFKKD